MVPSFLSLENLISDSYTFIRTLTRLTIYMYYSRLLVYDIVNLVTVSLLMYWLQLYDLYGAHRFVFVTAPVRLSSFCNQYTSSKNRDQIVED